MQRQSQLQLTGETLAWAELCTTVGNSSEEVVLEQQSRPVQDCRDALPRPLASETVYCNSITIQFSSARCLQQIQAFCPASTKEQALEHQVVACITSPEVGHQRGYSMRVLPQSTGHSTAPKLPRIRQAKPTTMASPAAHAKDDS